MDKVEHKKSLYTPPKKCKQCKTIICRCLIEAHLKKQEDEKKKNDIGVIDHSKV